MLFSGIVLLHIVKVFSIQLVVVVWVLLNSVLLYNVVL